MASKRKKAEEKAEPMVYVGPSLPHGKLLRFTVFASGDYLPHVKELMQQSPSLRGLMVPVSKLNQAKHDVETQGHILNLYASRVLKEIKE